MATSLEDEDVDDERGDARGRRHADDATSRLVAVDDQPEQERCVADFTWTLRRSQRRRAERAALAPAGPTTPAERTERSLGQSARDIELVMDAVGFERAAITAEGFAGHVAVMFAVRYPERIERLALRNSFAQLVAPENIEPTLATTIPL